MKKQRSWDRTRDSVKALALPVLSLLLSGLAPAQAVLPGKGAGQENFRISVEVDLVVLQATVRDRKGHTVPGLEERNFRVYDQGVVQPIHLFRHDDTPVTIGLVVDHSGSMREKLGQVTSAAQTFVSYSNPEDQMFVVNFNEKSSLGLGGTMRFSSSAEELGTAIGGSPATGLTALYDAIAEALQGLRNGEWDKKILIVISDGGDNASRISLDGVLRMAEQSNAVIYTIGVFDEGDPDRNPSVLKRLAHETGGEAYFPSKLSETIEICKRIARDVRDQYTIGYSSIEGRPGAYHTIRVTAQSAEDGKLSVRTRAGYIAGGIVQTGKDEK